MSEPVSTDEFATAIDRLVGQVSHWTPSRWGAASRVCARSRADVTHGLVQVIADLAADAEGRTRRTVPRLDNDLALPDQLVVVARDLLRAAPTPRLSAAAVSAVRQARADLWG